MATTNVIAPIEPLDEAQGQLALASLTMANIEAAQRAYGVAK